MRNKERRNKRCVKGVRGIRQKKRAFTGSKY
jgi:hypothetical protein